MRSVLGYAAALAAIGCGVPSAPVEPAVTAEAIVYAEETDRAIDVAIAAGQQVGRDANAAYRAAIEALKDRTDASERLVVRAQQESDTRRLPVLVLLKHVEHQHMASQYLVGLAVRKPTPAIPSVARTEHNDERTDYERMLGESFAASSALVRQGNWKGLLDVYANADVNVAAVAAGNAAQAGMLDATARRTLNARGITGSFQPLDRDEILSLRNPTLGPSQPQQPIEGPQ